MAESAGSHVNIFKNLEDNIKIVVQQIKDGESERHNKEKFNPEKYWEHLGAVLKALSMEGTKFSLAFTKPPYPSVKDCAGMTVRMEKVVLELVTVYYCLPKSQGVTLRKSVQRAVLDMLDNVLGLVSSLAQLDPGMSERLQATGTVWEGANCFGSLPKSNQEAVLKSLEQSSGLVSDAMSELEEILNNNGRLEDIFGEDEEEEEMDNTDAWTAQDKELVAPVKGLINTAIKTLKKATQAAKGKAKCDSEDSIAQLDDLGDCALRLSPTVDNLTSCLYAPVDHTAVRNNAGSLSESITSILSVLRNSHITGPDDTKWLDFLSTANTHNLSTLTAILDK